MSNPFSGKQAALPISPFESRAERDFLLGECNRHAFGLVLSPPHWGSYGLRLIGPAGSGKSHLAAIFKARFPDVNVIDPASELEEETLFHRLNATKEAGGPLLLTSRPGWAPRLPDLASRWKALPAATLGLPDDGLFSALLEKQFADRQLRVSPESLCYLATRMERSFEEAARIVHLLDVEALRKQAPISIKLIREVLEQA